MTCNVSSPVLLHGSSAGHAGFHFAVPFPLFLLPLANLAQGIFDLILRHLRLLLVLFLLAGLILLFRLLLFLLFVFLVFFLAVLFLPIFLFLLRLVLFLLVFVLLFLVLLLFGLFRPGLCFLNLFENLTRLFGRRVRSLAIGLFERFSGRFHVVAGLWSGRDGL